MNSLQRLAFGSTLLAALSACAGPSGGGGTAALRPTPVKGGFAITAPVQSWFRPGATPGLDRPCLRGPMLFTSGPAVRVVRLADGEVVSILPLPEGVEQRPGTQWMTPCWVGDRLIAVRSDGVVVGYATDLTPAWSRAVTKSERGLTHGAVAAGGLAVVPTGNNLLALDAATGEPAWLAALDGPIDALPVSDGERVFAGTRKGDLFALNAADGEELWKRGGFGGWLAFALDGDHLFGVDRGQGGSADASELGQPVREGDRGGALFLIDTAEARPLWSSGLAATNASLPFVDGERVWLGFSNVVVPFDAATGKPDLPRGFTTGRNALGTPTAAKDAVAFGNLDGHLYVHDRTDGRVRWSFTPGANPTDPGAPLQVYGFALEGDRLVVRTQAGYYGLAQDDAATEPVEFGTALTAN